MSVISGRPLHYVFKIGNRAKNAYFFRNILGMKVLRHEEFKEGCEAECNGPYDNRWSKTMVGYGPESTHFAMELTYNYGVQSYELGNDFGGVTLKSRETLERARANDYPIEVKDGLNILVSPDGYQFFIVDEPQPTERDPVCEVTLNVSDLDTSKKYWNGLLRMQILCQCKNTVSLAYNKDKAWLRLLETCDALNRAAAYGRIAFAVPKDEQPQIEATIRQAKRTILKPMITLETPGKADVRVIILADPDGHEICFVDEEGFSELSEMEENGDEQLDKFIVKDPFQDKADVDKLGLVAAEEKKDEEKTQEEKNDEEKQIN